MSTTMNLSNKAKDFIVTPPFAQLIQSYSSAAMVTANIGGSTANFSVEDINAIVRIAVQIVDIGNRM